MGTGSWTKNIGIQVEVLKVQGYLKVKGQKNKSLGGNTHLVKVNDGYHQEWGSERSQVDRMNQRITH